MALKKKELEQMYEEFKSQFDEGFAKSILKPTGRGGVIAARDLIRACAIMASAKNYGAPCKEIKTMQDFAKHVPAAVRFRLSMDTPCLAYRYDELKPEAQKKLFDDPAWVATEKENGVRGVLIFQGNQGYLFSRNYSDVDCSVPDYWENVSQATSFDKDDVFGVDVEVKYEPDHDLIKTMEDLGVATESKLEAMSALLQTYPHVAQRIQNEYKQRTGKDLITFRLIHPLYYKGKNYIKKGVKLKEGKAVYFEVIDYAQKHGLNLKPIAMVRGNRLQKEQFLDTILEAGGEGVVFHNDDVEYCTSENRDRDCFVKLKRSVSGSLKSDGMGDSIDAFVTGFKMGNEGTGNEGLIGALELSIWLEEDDGSRHQHVISYAPNIPLEMKKQITITNPDGTVGLHPKMYGTVMTIDGQAISRVSLRLTHPRILNLRRFDKRAEDCIYSRSFLLSQQDNYR